MLKPLLENVIERIGRYRIQPQVFAVVVIYLLVQYEVDYLSNDKHTQLLCEQVMVPSDKQKACQLMDDMKKQFPTIAVYT